jgi:outer membrane protein insertion porin family
MKRHVTVLAALLFAASISSVSPMVAIPAHANLVTITEVPPSIPKNLHWGEILREVRIEGNEHTREWVIRSTLKSQIGHPYIQEHAELDVHWLMQLGSFTAVRLTTDPVADGIALIVTVTEATPYVPSLSLALTQENGLEIGPAISSSNLLGTAARASAYARFGGANNFGFRYADPMIRRRSFLLGYTFTYFHRSRFNELVLFDETTDELFLEFQQSTDDYGMAGLRLRYMALKSDIDGVTLGSDNYDHVPALGIFVRNDSRNSIYPTDGWYIDLEASKWGIFGGDGDYWRLDLDVRRYTRMRYLGDRHSLALFSYAGLVGGEVGVTVPEWAQYFVGGTNSVRGWSLGARAGQNQWLNTIEYWFRLAEQKRWKFWFIRWRMGLQAAAFFDFGTAWSEYQGIESNMIGGGGIGLRLTLPVVTMLRFDLAMGEDGAGVRLAIGGGEKATAQRERVR